MSQFVFSRQFYNDEVGRTYPYARLYFYDTNTFNFKDVYTDVERTIPADNPVIADERYPLDMEGLSETNVIVGGASRNILEYDCDH